MTFDQIVADVCGRMNLVSDDAKTRVGQSVNRHLRRVTATIGLEQLRFITRTGTTALDSDQVTFHGIEKIDRVFERGTDGIVRVLQPVSLAQLRESAASQGSRQSFAIIHQTATDITIALPGLALAVTDLYADGWTTLADLSGAEEPTIPSSFHDILTFEVVAEEYLRKGATDLADRFKMQAEALLKELRFHIADAPARDLRQGDNLIPGASGGATGGAGSSVITGDIVFDRDPGPPFHVTPGSGLVENLDADMLDGQHGAAYHDAAQLTGTINPSHLPPQPPPLAHHLTHEAGGSDAIKLDDLAAPDDTTDLDASTAKHGLLKKLSGVATQFLNGVGAWVAPLVGLHAPTHNSAGTDPVDVKALAGYPGGTANFLRADATFAVPPGGSGGGIPGGATTQVQFNDSGAFAGDAGLTYDKATKALAIGTNPATAGAVRLPNDTGMQWRNAAGAGDLDALRVDGNDALLLGGGCAYILQRAGALAFPDATLDLGSPALRFRDLNASGDVKAGRLIGDGSLITNLPVQVTPPGGATTQLQFNDAGAFAGDAGLTFNKTTKAVALTGDQLTTKARPQVALLHTGSTTKARFGAVVVDIAGLACNMDYDGAAWVRDDAAKHGFAAFVSPTGGLTVSISRVGGLAYESLFTVDPTGMVTSRRSASVVGTTSLAGATLTVDLLTGAAFQVTTNSGLTYVFANPPGPGVEFVFSLQLNITGAATLTWPASVTWEDGIAPLVPASGRSMVLGFSTLDGGTRWRGYVGGRNFLT